MKDELRAAMHHAMEGKKLMEQLLAVGGDPELMTHIADARQGFRIAAARLSRAWEKIR